MAKTQPQRSDRQSSDLQRACVAVFFTFAPIGFLIMMITVPPEGWLMGVISAFVAGMIAVAYTYAFRTRRKWLLVFIIPGQLVIPWGLVAVLIHTPVPWVGRDVPAIGRLSILAVMAVTSLIVGYLLMVRFVRSIESRAARARAELELARQIHTTLVPPIDIRTPMADVFAVSEPSSEMGGDLIDAVATDDRLDVLLGDVSGHGVGAGMVMAMLKGSLRTRLERGDDLGPVVTDVNRVLTELTTPNMFATFAAVRLRPGGTIQFALAGHLPILHYRAASARWDEHPNQSLPLGIEPEEEFVTGTTGVAAGDLLFIYTDGLTEVQNSAGQELTQAGLQRLIEGAVKAGGEPRDIHRSITGSVAAHGARMDDQSLVIIRVR